MSFLAPSTSSLQSTKRIDQGATSGKPQRQSPHTSSIHVLDDDSLLNIFYHYRPFPSDEAQGASIIFWRGRDQWVDELWWYELAQVCQRWRSLILGSSSYLGVCLVCTYGTPVADMLAHSLPLPLAIDYFDKYDNLTDDEEAIILAFNQRERIRRVRLRIPVTIPQWLMVAIDKEYPILEDLIIEHQIDENNILTLPETLQAPRLRHLALKDFPPQIGSRLLTTAVGLVTLDLFMNHSSIYIQPIDLLQWLSIMPKLEMLAIFFEFDVPYHDVERQLTITSPVTLPNLLGFRFQGFINYLETLAHRISSPRLEKLDIGFSDPITSSVPHLLRFMSTTENLRLDSAKLFLSRGSVDMKVYPREADKMYVLTIYVISWYLGYASTVAQFFDAPSQMSSAVDHLTLEYIAHSWSPEVRHEVDYIEWRDLLALFTNVKTLHVGDGLAEGVSRCLRSDDGELPLDLLPELQELTYSGNGNTGGPFISFIDARQSAGRPVTLVRLHPIPDSGSSAIL